MKKTFSLLLLSSILFSCGSIEKVQLPTEEKSISKKTDAKFAKVYLKINTGSTFSTKANETDTEKTIFGNLSILNDNGSVLSKKSFEKSTTSKSVKLTLLIPLNKSGKIEISVKNASGEVYLFGSGIFKGIDGTTYNLKMEPVGTKKSKVVQVTTDLDLTNPNEENTSEPSVEIIDTISTNTDVGKTPITSDPIKDIVSNTLSLTSLATPNIGYSSGTAFRIVFSGFEANSDVKMEYARDSNFTNASSNTHKSDSNGKITLDFASSNYEAGDYFYRATDVKSGKSTSTSIKILAGNTNKNGVLVSNQYSYKVGEQIVIKGSGYDPNVILRFYFYKPNLGGNTLPEEITTDSNGSFVKSISTSNLESNQFYQAFTYVKSTWGESNKVDMLLESK